MLRAPVRGGRILGCLIRETATELVPRTNETVNASDGCSLRMNLLTERGPLSSREQADKELADSAVRGPMRRFTGARRVRRFRGSLPLRERVRVRENTTNALSEFIATHKKRRSTSFIVFSECVPTSRDT